MPNPLTNLSQKKSLNFPLPPHPPYSISRLILIHDAPSYILIEDIYIRAREPARADAALEEEIEFGEGAAAGLRDAKVCVYYAEKAYSGLVLKGGAVLVGVFVDGGEGCRRKVWLREYKGGVHEDGGLPYPEETGVVAPVPCGWVEHVGR